MKCRYCGGEVALEERYCPYCGKPNELALQHHQAMADYQKRYAEAEKTVLGKADRYAQIIPRVLIILVLLLVIFFTSVIAENAYYFPEQLRSFSANRNAKAVISTLDSFLKNRDYLSFASYLSYNGIRTYSTAFSDYSSVQWCAEDYQDFILQMEKLFLHTDREKWIKYSASADIQRLCQSLEYFLEAYERSLRDDQLPLCRSAMDDMRNSMLEMLHVYLGIGTEDLDSFLSLSENKKAAYIEEVLLNAEKG